MTSNAEEDGDQALKRDGSEFDILGVVQQRAGGISNEKEREKMAKYDPGAKQGSKEDGQKITVEAPGSDKVNGFGAVKKIVPSSESDIPSKRASEARNRADNKTSMSFFENKKKGHPDLVSGELNVMHLVRERAKEASNADEGEAAHESKKGDHRDQAGHESKKKDHRDLVSGEFNVMDLVRERAKEASNAGDDQTTQQQSSQQQSANARPGAFSKAPGERSERLDNISFSLVGAVRGLSRAILLDNDSTDPLSAGGNEPTLIHNADSRRNLAQAMPIEEDALPDIEAQPFDVDESKRRKLKSRRRHMWYLFLMMALIIVAVAIILGLTLANSEDNISTYSPSSAPSMAPSSAPTGALDQLLQDLSQTTLENLKSISTPQWQAQAWLQNHPQLTSMPEWRKQQLFALATFYYAMEGNDWPQAIRDNWLQYSDECLWFSSEFGDFGERGEWKESTFYNMTPCNDENEFQFLFLYEMELPNSNPFIPPEISLLASLSILALPWNGINASINDFLPSAVFLMSNLTELNLYDNFLSGTIPKALGMMSNLGKLILDWNSLSSTMPCELGMLTGMTDLWLYQNSLTGSIPSELGLMTDMALLDLDANLLTGLIPTEMGLMSSMTTLFIAGNSLTGQLPSELGLMTNMALLELYDNQLTGLIPTEMGLMSSMTSLFVHGNSLVGQLPSELGVMTNVTDLHICSNGLTGPLPTELGAMSKMENLELDLNALSGSLPSELGLMTSMTGLLLASNTLSGPIPSEIGSLSSLSHIWINNNMLTGSLPQELDSLVLNGSLLMLNLENNDLSGTISEDLCSLGLLAPDAPLGLSFNCSEQLCGCCWCPCPGSNASTSCSENVVAVYNPAQDDEEWPGVFPSPIGTSNVVTINIHTDEYPDETALEWSVQDKQYGSWNVLESISPPQGNSLYSHTKVVESNSLYRLRLSDTGNDGTCCQHGFGWFTITNSTPSLSHDNGTVIWSVPGDAFNFSLEVHLDIDPNGRASLTSSVSYPVETLIEQAEDWPGAFPTPTNGSNAVAINIHTDNYPEETSLEWSIQNDDGHWEILDSAALPHHLKNLISYTKQVQSNALYRLQIYDTEGDGICCAGGIGWFTITNSTSSGDHKDGTVIWKATGLVLESSLDVFLWVDASGHAYHVEYLPGQGYALTQEELVQAEPIIVVPGANSSKVVSGTLAP